MEAPQGAKGNGGVIARLWRLGWPVAIAAVIATVGFYARRQVRRYL